MNSPVNDVSARPNGLQSKDMICGFLPWAGQSANRKISVAPGANIGLQWWHEKPGDDFIASSHHGPCFAYLAKTSSTPSGQVWFKIYEKGYNNQTKQFCIDEMLQSSSRGLMTFQIPNDLAPGDYVLRGELIALHDGNKRNGAQPYVHCAEITVTGNGTRSPPSSALVTFPGAYQASDPGIFFDIYPKQGFGYYPTPGPPVWS
eukprot:TRINITY_DN1444_c0_g1_i1.p1 TRINITY_DN1444_c0_g1~~TRINITY_DN1444_c0_g1_i1.p1  ORF type:complete len:203 (-),score=36.81 TRINITY_DN1444_c0_g1_i1:133-741(-)